MGFLRLEENLIDLVAKKMGVAVLTRRPISGRTYEDVGLCDVGPYVSTCISLVYQINKIIADPLKCFLGYVQTYVKENETVSEK